MTYELKGGEEWCDGVLFGWTGEECPECKGYGQAYRRELDADGSCKDCAGTGEKWGRMPKQPTELPTTGDSSAGLIPQVPKDQSV